MTWVVIGASSAIARAFAREVARAGEDVILAGRDTTDLEHNAADIRARFGVAATVDRFDARDRSDHHAFVIRCGQAAPLLNIFLAFGSMPDQAVMEKDPERAADLIAVNYTGAVSVLLHFATLLEERKAGRIVVMGSVAGDRGRLKNYIYGSSKAALDSFTQGLRARLWRANVTVTTVKPGFVDTAMTWGQPGLFLVATPESCARACLRAARKGRAVIYVPLFWRWIMMIIRFVPEVIFKRLSI